MANLDALLPPAGASKPQGPQMQRRMARPGRNLTQPRAGMRFADSVEPTDSYNLVILRGSGSLELQAQGKRDC
jgi:hypothetical protein